MKKAILALFLASILQAAVINVVGTDTAAIHQAITASAPGDTVNFPAGTYLLPVFIAGLPNRIYQGQPGAILKGSLGGPLFQAASDSTIDGFIFDGGGVAFAALSANVSVTHNRFQNIITANSYSMDGINAMTGLTNSTIAFNSFANIYQAGHVAGWSEVCGAIWVINPSTVAITDNIFDQTCQAIHVTANVNTSGLSVLRNTITASARHSIEIQGNFAITNVLVNQNSISQEIPGINGQMGISVAVGGTGHQILNNTLAGPNQGHPNTWQSAAIEAMGTGFLIQGNIAGHWQSAQLIGWSDNTWITKGNSWCDMTDPNGNSIIYLEDHGQAPGTNVGNTVTAACQIPFPPVTPTPPIVIPTPTPPIVVPTKPYSCLGSIPGTLVCQ